MNLETSSSCHLMSVMILNLFVLRKYRLIFEFCHYFFLFLSILGAHSVRKAKNRFPKGFNTIFVIVLCLTNGIFVLTRRLFIFFIVEHNCII